MLYRNLGKHRRVVCIAALTCISLLLCASFVAAASSETVGVDLEKDLRKFDQDWLADNTEETDFESLDNLNDVYDTLKEEWNGDNAKTISDDDYRTYDHVDITEIKVENLDKDDATFKVNVVGNPEDTDHPWAIYLWSDCGDDVGQNNMYFIIGVYVSGGLNGGDYNAYSGVYGDDNTTGEMDIDSNDDGGHDISIDFPSDWWEEKSDCDLRCIMFTTTEDDVDGLNESDLVMDIFPGNQGLSFDWLFWIILLIIIIIAALAIYLIVKRYRNKNKSGKRVVK